MTLLSKLFGSRLIAFGSAKASTMAVEVAQIEELDPSLSFND